jgi:hypothetical protein
MGDNKVIEKIFSTKLILNEPGFAALLADDSHPIGIHRCAP